MDRRLALAAALLVAVPLLGNSFLFALPADPPAYQHSIESVEGGEVPPEAEVYQYENLSTEARAAVDAALAAPDGRATVTGEANRPPEFHYSDHVTWGQGWYVVEKDGARYKLTTSASGSIDARPIVRGLLVALGLVVALVGLAGYRTDAEYVPGVVAVAAVLPLLPILAGAYRSADAAVVVGTLGALGVGLVGLGTLVSARVAAACTVASAGIGFGLAVLTGLGIVPVLFVVGLGASVGCGSLMAQMERQGW